MEIKSTYSDKPMPYDKLFDNLYKLETRKASFKTVKYKKLD